MGCVYIARCSVNGKYYAGRTVCSLEKRRRDHEWNAKNGEPGAFYNAIRLYGAAAFEWRVAFESDDPEELNVAERLVIKKHKSFGRAGYNLTEGGEGCIGYKHTKEVRVYLRERANTAEVQEALARGRTPEMYAQNSIKLTGQKRTPEQCERNRQAHLGKSPTEATRLKLHFANVGKVLGPYSPERCKNIAIGTRKAMEDPVVRARVETARLAAVSKPHTTEHNTKIGAGVHEAMKDHRVRRRIAEGVRWAAYLKREQRALQAAS